MASARWASPSDRGRDRLKIIIRPIEVSHPAATAPHGRSLARCKKSGRSTFEIRAAGGPQWPGARQAKALKNQHTTNRKARIDFAGEGYLRPVCTYSPYQLCTCTNSASQLMHYIAKAPSCWMLRASAANFATDQHEHLLMSFDGRDYMMIQN